MAHSTSQKGRDNRRRLKVNLSGERADTREMLSLMRKKVKRNAARDRRPLSYHACSKFHPLRYSTFLWPAAALLKPEAAGGAGVF